MGAWNLCSTPLAAARALSYRGTDMRTQGAGNPPPSSFDSVILAAVVAECQDLVGARVQRVIPAGPAGLAIVLRSRRGTRTLLVSAHPRWHRVHLARGVPHAGASSFVQMVRSRLEGAALRAVTAPPFERLITCAFETLEGPHDLVAELVGRTANLVLCSGGLVAGALRTGGGGARGPSLQRPYSPPQQTRPDPLGVTQRDLTAALAGEQDPAHGTAPTRADAEHGGERPAWRLLLDTVAGIGPALAWETCLRAGLHPERPFDPSDAPGVIRALRDLGQAVLLQQFSAVLYRNPDGLPVAYAAFPMRAYAALRPEPSSISAAVEAVTGRLAAYAHLEALRKGMASAVAQALKRVARAQEAVALDLRDAQGAAAIRQFGELILAYLPQIAPESVALDVPGFDGQMVRIPLDPARSGVENAQAYFKRYTKLASALRRLPARKADLEAERAFLMNVSNAVAQAETEDDLRAVEQDLAAAGRRQPKGGAARPRPASIGRTFELPGGYQARAGRSAGENDHLTFEVAGPGDLWLHARGMPGAHIIVTGGREPPEPVVAAAAGIAAYYSAGRSAGAVPVDVTRRRFVRRLRGGRPGQVQYTGERTLLVRPALPAPR